MRSLVFLFLILLSFDVAAGKNLCQNALSQEFNIRVGDVALNSTEHLVHYLGKTAQLTPVLYALFEELILHEGKARYEDFVEARDAANTNRKRDWDPYVHYHNHQARMIREVLSREFGPAFASRIVVFYGQGYLWFTPPPEPFPKHKIWYREAGDYFMINDTIYSSNRRTIGILKAFLINKCRPLEAGMINDFLVRNNFPVVPNEVEMRGAILKLNKEFQKSIQFRERLFASLGYRTHAWEINRAYVDFCP